MKFIYLSLFQMTPRRQFSEGPSIFTVTEELLSSLATLCGMIHMPSSRSIISLMKFHWEVFDMMSGMKPAFLHARSEEHTSELQSRGHLVWRLLLEKKQRYNRRE